MNATLKPYDTSIARIEQILTEPSVFSNDDIHIVRDADPITTGHFLAFSKPDFSSFADHAAIDSCLSAIYEAEFFQGRDWLFFERGRAPFCTSLNGPHRAHIHLIPKDELDSDVLVNLCKECSAEFIGSPSDALRHKSHSTEQYMCFGEIGKSGYVAAELITLAGTQKKRFLRHFLSHHIR